MVNEATKEGGAETQNPSNPTLQSENVEAETIVIEVDASVTTTLASVSVGVPTNQLQPQAAALIPQQSQSPFMTSPQFQLKFGEIEPVTLQTPTSML